MLKSEESENNVISFIAGDFLDGNQEIDENYLRESLPILPLRNTIVFPGSGLPISVGRSKSLKLVRALGKKHRYIGLVCQKDNNIEEPEKEDLYQIGVIAEVIRVIELDKNNLSIIVQAKKRFEWTEFTQTEPFFTANYKILESKKADKDDREFKAILDSIRDSMN
ncbi:MAG: LON peptidase substrate-binding domain-containing protein, partial [Petrimonas sp.]|nr:LON peptidase substrate-binding domain-containing protein [Petrimonas sp.]